MKMKNKILLVVTLLVAILSVSACNSDKRTESEKFNDYVDELTMDILKSSPILASTKIGDLESYGLSDLASQLDHVTIPSNDETTEGESSDALSMSDYIEKVEAFDEEKLSEEDLLLKELVLYELNNFASMEDYSLFSNYINPVMGVHIEYPLVFMQFDLETKEAIEAHLSRVGEFGRFLEEVTAFEEYRNEQGIILPSGIYKEVIGQIETMMEDAKEYMVYKDFVTKLEEADITDDEKEEYKDQMIEIIEDKIYPALEEMKELCEAYPEDNSDVSIYFNEEGQQYYEDLVDYKTSGEMDVDELRTWAEETLESSMDKMQEVSAHEDFNFAALAVLPTYDELSEIEAIVDEFLAEDFYDYGIESAEYRTIPEYLEDQLPAGFYFPITIDKKALGNMYLQQGTYDNLDSSTLELFIHENQPGHHLYFAYKADHDVQDFRKVFDNISVVEGWATYLQVYTYQRMGINDVTFEYIESVYDFTSAVSILVDIYFHYDGYTIDEVKQFLAQYGMGHMAVDSSMNRMICNAAEPVHYFFGRFKVNEFRTYFEEEVEANNLDLEIKDFHDFLLENHDLPFFMIEEALEEYLENTVDVEDVEEEDAA